MPRVVHVRDRVPGAVFIGRPSRYGNPFKIGRDGTRAEVIEKYRQYIHKWLSASDDFPIQLRRELRGKDLACFCTPLPCHGDILLAIANEWVDEAVPEPRR